MGKISVSQEKMSNLIETFIALCCKLENENPGLTEFILKETRYKDKESITNTLYFKDHFMGFAMLLNDLRSIWLLSVGILKQRNEVLI